MRIDNFCEQILTHGPSSNTLFIIFTILKEEGHFKRVIQECLKALKIYPDDIKIRQLLAETYLNTGQTSQAEAELAKVDAQLTDLAQCYKLQAKIYYQQGREKEAAKALKCYLAHRPDDEEAQNTYTSLMATGETHVMESSPGKEELAMQADEKVGKKAPIAEESDLPDIATPTLAEIYVDQGQISDAIEIYNKLVNRNPGDERSKQRLAELKSIKEEEETREGKGIGSIVEKKLKLIAILEKWLVKIQEKSKPRLSVA